MKKSRLFLILIATVALISCGEGPSDSGGGVPMLSTSHTITITSQFHEPQYVYISDGKTFSDVKAKVALFHTGYKITDWLKGTQRITDDYVIKDNDTFEAQWTAISYTVKFTSNGGTGSLPNNITAKYDAEFTLPNNTFTPPAPYKSTDGWMTGEEGGRGEYFADRERVKNLCTTDGGEVTLKACYSEYDFVISFCDEESNLIKKIPCTTGETPDLSDVKIPTKMADGKPVKTGYTLTGWYNTAGEKVDLNNLSATSSLMLKLQLNPIKYTITFDKNDCEGDNLPDIKCVYDTTYTLPKNNLTKKGYIVSGFYTGSSYNKTTYENEERVKNLASTEGAVVKMYSYYYTDSITPCTITLETDHGTLTDSQKSFIVKCNDTILQYNYRSSSGEKKSLPDLRSSAIIGYTFGGWAVDGSNKAFSYSYRITEDTKFKALWIPMDVTITFDENCPAGATGYWKTSNHSDTQSTTYNTATKLNPVPFYITGSGTGNTTDPNTAYFFKGWSKNKTPAATDTLIADEGNYTFTSTQNNPSYYDTLYAQWEMAPVSVGISIVMPDRDSDIGLSYSYNRTLNAKTLNASLAGFTGTFYLYVDGSTSAALSAKATGEYNPSADFDPFALDLTAGPHTLTVKATKDGITYSAAKIINITQN